MSTYLDILKSILLHPANSKNQINAVIRVIKYRLAIFLKKKAIYIPAFGYKMKLYLDAEFSRSYVYFTAHKNYELMNFIKKYLRPGDAFIDIGANVGVYTLLAASLVGKTGTIDSFEPVPSTFKRLQENINLNLISFAKLHPYALGENSSLISFTSDLDEVNHAVIFRENETYESKKLIEVQCHPIEEILPSTKSYAMAKIDVEGLELSVLKGATQMLSQHNPPVLALEINGSSERYNHSASDIINFLNKYDYHPVIYDVKTNSLSFDFEIWDDVLFIHREFIDFVVDRIKK